MSKNEPMTKQQLEDSAFATLRFPLADALPDTQPQMVNSVTLADALAYGDERYEAGRTEGARQARVLVICKPCQDGTHYHTEGQVGHLICDCGCWWPLKQRVLYGR